jgi:hypothetical protein
MGGFGDPGVSEVRFKVLDSRCHHCVAWIVSALRQNGIDADALPGSLWVTVRGSTADVATIRAVAESAGHATSL